MTFNMMRRVILIRAALVAALLASCVSIAFANESLSKKATGTPVRFAVATTVSEAFHQETADATESIPTQVWQTLEQSGWRVQVAEFVVDAAPSLRGVRPRGWPRNMTWENSDAIHLPTSKLLVVAEKRRDSTGNIVSSSRVPGVLRHELGHAFDMAMGGTSRFLSSKREFVSAYLRDTRQLTTEQRATFDYYLQGDRAGWQEAFAEAFAVALGGGSSDVEADDFRAAFPEVMAYVQTVIDDPPRPLAGAKPRVQSRSRVVTRQPLRRRGLFRR